MSVTLGKLIVKEGISVFVKTTSTTPFLVEKTDDIINYVATASSVINLPPVADFWNTEVGGSRKLTIKDAGLTAETYNIVITPNGAELIDGDSSLTIDSKGKTVELYTDGSNWLVLTEKKNNITDAVFKPNVDPAMSGDVLDIDGSRGNFFDIYLNRPLTRINMPINLINGKPYKFQIRQDHIGGRAIKWGSLHLFTGLNVECYHGMGDITLIINSGTFDWSVLKVGAGRKSFINIAGFSANENNTKGLKVSSFDESTGEINIDSPSWSLANLTESGITLEIENAFYFFDEKNDSWISQFQFGVTVFSGWTASEGASLSMVKDGVYSNILHQRAKIRFEEELTDDFINGSDNGFLNWREANSNGSVGVSSADIDSNHIGIIAMAMTGGATSDGRASNTLGNDMFNVSNMRVGISAVIKANENAFETANVKYYFGWSDNNKFQSAIDGFYFEIIADGSGDGYGRVWAVSEKAGVKTSYDTGIDLYEDEWYILHIGKPAGGGDIHFTINDITVHEVAQSTIGITAKLTCGFACCYDYTGTPLPDNKTMFIDAFSLKYRMNHDRI